MFHSNTQAFCHRLSCRANAWAALRGLNAAPEILGSVKFFQTSAGLLILTEIWSLPPTETGVYGFGICGGEPGQQGSFPEPSDRPGFRSGLSSWTELPALVSRKGFAWSAFLTAQFPLRDILGSIAAVLDAPGGKRIACGEIRGI